MIMFILIVVGIQVVAAHPFISSGKTSIIDYLKQSCLIENGDKFRGAKDFLDSVFWRFIGRSRYMIKMFTYNTIYPMMIVNVFYFFIVRNNFMKCLLRFADTVMEGKTNKKTRLKQSIKMIEMIFIMYVSTIQFIPGGHENF